MLPLVLEKRDFPAIHPLINAIKREHVHERARKGIKEKRETLI